MQDTKPNPKDERGLHPLPAVGIVCWKGEEVLLIRRGRAPRLGQWSIPGGKVHRGEPLQKAGLRELYEETGVTAEICGLIEVYEIIEPQFHYVLIDYAAVWTGGDASAGDDAAEARFVPLEEALRLVTQQDIVDVIQRSRAVIVAYTTR